MDAVSVPRWRSDGLTVLVARRNCFVKGKLDEYRRLYGISFGSHSFHFICTSACEPLFSEMQFGTFVRGAGEVFHHVILLAPVVTVGSQVMTRQEERGPAPKILLPYRRPLLHRPPAVNPN